MVLEMDESRILSSGGPPEATSIPHHHKSSATPATSPSPGSRHPRRRHRAAATVALLAASVVPIARVAAQRPARGASQAALLARIAVIEDARGTQGHDLNNLVPLLAHADPTIRAAAVRALGRQQRTRWLDPIYAAMHDPAPLVRLAAINALGQALTETRTSVLSVTAPAVVGALDTLRRVLVAPGVSPAVGALVARTIGRLPYKDSATARRAEAAIVDAALSAVSRATLTPVQLLGSLHGLYALARQRRTLGAASAAAVGVMRSALETRAPREREGAARVRRLAMLALVPAGGMDSNVVKAALRDDDEQVRGLAVAAEGALRDTVARLGLIRRGLRDPSPLVRLDAVRAARGFAATEGCSDITSALGDASAHVVLAAIDGLSATCRDAERVTTVLLGLIDANRSDSPSRAPGRSGWHIHAHALLALARTAPDRALPIVRRDAAESTLGTVRTWIARAAAQLRDTVTLARLAGDPTANVRQAALGGLSALAGHAFDSTYARSLTAPEHQVVMEAAQVLKGSADPQAVPALLAALERLTALRRENTRDARQAILDRLDELGTVSIADRLQPLRTDYDSAVAQHAAAILTRWTGSEVAAAPVPLPLPVEALAPLMADRWVARIIMSPMSGGGSFDVELFPREAPLTVARFARLARAGHYDGLTFHRVEPGFVIQGGSPAANEFVGDGPFMRDELDTRSHTRGTVGISTRGRDTGDAQIFVNLTDNFRLDHDYTVFGEIIRGRDLAERVLEGDIISRIEIKRNR